MMSSTTDASTDDVNEFGDTTDQLATYITNLSFEDLPAEVVELERWHLLDTLGCILYGTSTPWVEKVIGALDDLGETGHGSASIPNIGKELSPARVCLVTGTSAHAMDYDDYCQDAGVHAGSAVVPAVLAFTEAANTRVSGKEVLTALAAGVEVAIRTGYGIGRSSLFRGWHIAGWTDAFGGAATSGFLRELDHDQMGHALAIAGTQGAGLMGAATSGAEVKRFHMGKAAESGYLATALGARDMTGDPKIFQEHWGAIGTTMSEDYDIPAVTDGLGESYELLDTLTFKPFPSVGQTHPPVSAVKEIVESNDLDTADISHVHVRATSTAKNKAGQDFEPVGVMAAQSSIQYAIATFLVDGEVRIDAYTEEAIRRESVLDRVGDIDIIADDSLVSDAEGYNSRYRVVVEVKTEDDETYEATVQIPKGFPENPMSDEELLSKFREQANHVLPEENVEAIIEFVMNLERKDDFAEIIPYLKD